MAENTNISKLSVFVINKDLPSNRDANVTDYDLFEAINVALDTKNEICCIQREGEIWRVDLKSAKDCQKLKEEGIKVNEPFPKGVRIPTTEGKEKILICGLPYYIENKNIKDILKQMGVKLLTDVMFKDIFDPDTNKRTLVRDGNRSVYISSLEKGKCLPRNATCAGFTCRLYHSGQETRTFKVNCYDKVCRVCLEPDHDPTSPDCWYNTNQSEEVVTLSKAGKRIPKTFPRPIIETTYKEKIVILNEETNPLSMSFPRQFIFEDKPYNSAMEAYQTKRSGGIQSNSSVETSHGFEVNSLEIKGWTEQREKVIKDILLAKFNQVEEMREKLKSIITKSAVFAEATDDYYWGTGLSREETEQTHSSQWPGENRLGEIVKEIASEKIKIHTITLYTLNANKLRNAERRCHLFTWLKECQFDIIFLQETCFSADIMQRMAQNDDFRMHNCYAVESKGPKGSTSRIGGVSVFVKKSLFPALTCETRDFIGENGRTLLIHVRYRNKTYIMINVYAKSGNNTVSIMQRTDLFDNVFDFIKKYYKDEENIALAGDFNCHLDSSQSDTSRDVLIKHLSELKLFDAWKHFHEKTDGFTFKRGSRIDYIFLHNNLKSSIVDINVVTPRSMEGKLFSDHAGICLELGVLD